MDSFWIEIAKQVPALAVLVLMLLAFLKHLESRNQRDNEKDLMFSKTLENIGKDCHEFQERCLITIDANTARVVTAVDEHNKSNARSELIIARVEAQLSMLEQIQKQRMEPQR